MTAANGFNRAVRDARRTACNARSRMAVRGLWRNGRWKYVAVRARYKDSIARYL